MPRPLQKETQEKRRKYIENRTIGGMNKKRAALEAGFSLAMARLAVDQGQTAPDLQPPTYQPEGA